MLSVARTPMLPKPPTTVDFPCAIGVVMRALRKQSGLTTAEVGELMGYHPAYVRIMSSGAVYSGHEFLENYAVICGSSLSNLMRRAWETEDVASLLVAAPRQASSCR